MMGGQMKMTPLQSVTDNVFQDPTWVTTDQELETRPTILRVTICLRLLNDCSHDSMMMDDDMYDTKSHVSTPDQGGELWRVLRHPVETRTPLSRLLLNMGRSVNEGLPITLLFYFLVTIFFWGECTIVKWYERHRCKVDMIWCSLCQEYDKMK